MTRVLVTLAPLFLAGCIFGDGNDDDKPTDVGTTETGQTTTTTTTTETGTTTAPEPATVVVDPPDGHVDVAPRPFPTLTFSRPVDGLSLKDATLEVVDGLGRPIEAVATLDKDQVTVVIDPLRPFFFGDTIDLSFSGATMADGTDAPTAEATWEIQAQPGFATRAIISEIEGLTYDRDADGNLIGVDRFDLGPDGMFPSADDEISGYQINTLQPNGRPARIEVYEDAGPDEMFKTADDLLSFVLEYQVAGTQETEIRTQAGADGVLGTADDMIESQIQTDYDAEYRVVREIRSEVGPGPDGTWLTPDDEDLIFLVFDRDADGLTTQVRVYDGVGDDGTFFTADDTLTEYYAPEYDSNRRLRQTLYYTTSGADGVWFNGDDFIAREDRRVYNSYGQLSQAYNHDGPGLDGNWFTGDETGELITYLYSGAQILRRTVTYTGIGADGAWGTVDDEIDNYVDYDFEPTGFYTRFTRFNTSGPGGVWFDDDDQVIEEVTYAAPRDATAGPKAVMQTRSLVRPAHDPHADLYDTLQFRPTDPWRGSRR